MISVIISTLNRPEKLQNCLYSILANTFSGFEIIVIDQNRGNTTKRVVQNFLNESIRYIKIGRKGLSRARNLGIRVSKGNILAFTTDDCIVDKHWLKNIDSSFQEKESFPVVFGRVVPFRPEHHPGLISPGVSDPRRTKREILTKISYELFDFGIGNNIAVRKSTFNKIGDFKEWLGAGSVGRAGEEGELIYRVLREKKQGTRILFNPEILVYHDRWLNQREYEKQQFSYNYGTISVLEYYYFLGDKRNKKYIIRVFKDKREKRHQEIKTCIVEFHPKWLVRIAFDVTIHALYYAQGVLVARYFARLKRMQKK